MFTKMKISESIVGEHSISNFSTNFFGGREIAQEGGEILNFRQNFGNIL